MINRKQLVAKHNPMIRSIEVDSPLTVGNGEFAFTADVTGMQTLYDLYHQHHMPLCTMSQWGWHTEAGENYTLADVKLTAYDYDERTVFYPIEKKAGNEKVYEWLRHNPHRANLARIGLTWSGAEVLPEEVTDVQQQLHLYEGRLVSQFSIKNQPCQVTTVCHHEVDSLGFQIHSEADEVQVKLAFPYGSHHMCGSDWEGVNKHVTQLVSERNGAFLLKRVMDDAIHYVEITCDEGVRLEKVAKHEYALVSSKSEWGFSVHFSSEEPKTSMTFSQCVESSRLGWERFWSETGIVDFKASKDPRAHELERRLILSQYLTTIQCSGSLPPQETGLTCNSWHGKFHLEMHLWHGAYLPLWNQGALLERSFPWYESIMDEARHNAAKNGFKGVRWPKQVANDGIDSPSVIAPLLVWQQSHIVYMLELIYQKEKSEAFLHQNWELVKETTAFMCDFLVFNEKSGLYELGAPLIPAQEEHDPRVVKNPTFEVEYWHFSIGLAIKWAERLGKSTEEWQEVFHNMASSPVGDGLYLAHETCETTFTEFNRDHPSMLGAFGLIPGERVDVETMKATVYKVLDCWEFETMWGWDFALMAMTAVRLGMPELAMDILLMDSPKNEYVISGNNFQRLRTDLPLYLPGNGSLLLAVALMVAGYGESSEELPGIPKNGMWDVEFENISKFPY